MKELKSKIKKVINKQLKATLNCDFKKAFLPKGYTFINIKVFSENLSNLIIEKISQEK